MPLLISVMFSKYKVMTPFWSSGAGGIHEKAILVAELFPCKFLGEAAGATTVINHN